MTMVRATLADGSTIEGELGGWYDGVIELDGRRWDGLLFFEPIDDDEVCATCAGTGLTSYSGRGSDGPDPCLDCWGDET